MIGTRAHQPESTKNIPPKARILVVEDDLNLLEGIQTVLELDHYSVVCAENGRQALEVLKTSPIPPKLIVSDIMMPQMDGIEFLQAVRAVPSWVRIPFIFLTARGEKQDIQRGKQLGVDDYLVKPFDADDLLVAIEAKLKRVDEYENSFNGEMIDLKHRILTILNHEFRTPLTYVVAYADMLREANENPVSDDDMNTFLKGVSTGAIRLRRLIENFIQLVEMETGDAERTYEMRKAPITDVRDLLERSFREIQSGRTILQEVSIVTDPVPTFVADEVYLKMALTQLIDNAVKFSTSDQPITIGAHVVGEEVCMWVEDQGRGIELAEQELIFEPFHQVDRKRYEDPGTGSGLAIVSNVAKLHGGRVEVESEPKQGSRFSIYIPLSSAKQS